MSVSMRIKGRASGAAGPPAEMLRRELAFNEADGNLYIGTGNGGGDAADTATIIGGRAFEDAASLVRGMLDDERLRWSLREYALQIDDWNNADYNGWFKGGPGTINAPVSIFCIGYVVAHTANWFTQVVWAFTANSEADTMTFRRERNRGAFGDWERCRITQAEMDNRYAQIGNHTSLINSMPTYGAS